MTGRTALSEGVGRGRGERTRLVAEAALRAVVGSWDRIGHPPIETRIVEIARPDAI